MNTKARPSTSNGAQIACKLTDEEQQKRREELSRELFWGCQKIEELDDGYEFVFPGGADWAARIVGFLVEERRCCPFFTFEMVFKPYGGPISLRIRGPKEAKEFTEEGIIYAGVLEGTEARVFRSDDAGEVVADQATKKGVLMSYREIRIPEELNRRIQEMFEFPPQRHETLGELIATYKEHQGAPRLEDLVSESPTRHEVRVGERTFHTHCFLDALVLPLVLGEESAEIRSESPVSGEKITAVVSDGAVEYSPAGATMSFGVTRAGHGPPQLVGCPYINAFTSRAEYERWEAEKPQAITTPLSVQDAFALARDAVGEAEAPSE